MNNAFSFIRPKSRFGSPPLAPVEEWPLRGASAAVSLTAQTRPSGRGSGQPLRLASEPRGALSDPMPPARTIVKYAIDALLIFAPLCGVMYFLFDPDAFNAFLAWLARVL